MVTMVGTACSFMEMKNIIALQFPVVSLYAAWSVFVHATVMRKFCILLGYLFLCYFC